MSPNSPTDQPPRSPSRIDVARGGEEPGLVRGIGLAQATTLNMIDMIGVGPFITIPLILCGRGRPTSHAGMDSWRSIRSLRWPGMGGTGRGDAECRRFLRVPQGVLRPEILGPVAVVPVHLAAVVQRATVHRIGLYRPVPLCGISLAEPRTHHRRAHISHRAAADRRDGSARAGYARNLGGHRHLRHRGAAALPPDYRCRQAGAVPMGGRCAGSWMGDLRRTDTLQRGSGVRLSSRAHSHCRRASSWDWARRC